MVSRYKNNLNQIVAYDFISKFNYNHSNQLPQISQVSINISDPTLVTVKSKILYYLYLIRTITNQTPKETVSKKNKIKLKIKRDAIIGCKVDLDSNKSLEFLEYLTLFIIPQIKDFTGFTYNLKNKNQLSLHIRDWHKTLPDDHMYKNATFYNKSLPSLQVTIKFNSVLTNELICMLNACNFPIA
jgi:ribosomal protein L5